MSHGFAGGNILYYNLSRYVYADLKAGLSGGSRKVLQGMVWCSVVEWSVVEWSVG